ncbi:hypothetical protein C8Q74DRAFT_1282120 [Fomes fomentarius]|nr:hypothetical protein C8Q74DRAFT_1282120 [Fomes fomentarius]
MSLKLDPVFGAILLGTFISLLLQGAIFLQAYYYYCNYHSDKWLLKIWVGSVVILEALNSALIMQVCYSSLITGFGDTITLSTSLRWPSAQLLVLVSAFVMLVVEIFFVRRLWILGSKKWYRIAAVAAALFNTASISCLIALYAIGYVSCGEKDIFVTSALIHALAHSRTGMKQTSSTIDTLIRYALSTGLVICVFNVVLIAVGLTEATTLIFVALGIVATKVYANVFLVALNIRNSILSAQQIKQEQRVNLAIGRRNARSGSQSARNNAASSSGLEVDLIPQHHA